MLPSRAGRLLVTWTIAIAAEAVTWWLFVRSSYFRDLFLPVTILVLIAALAVSWRIVRGRSAERRRGAGDRRDGDRRGG